MSEDLAGDVDEALATDVEAFRERAAADAEVVKSELREGAFDNHQSIIGLEYEFYAVADGRWTDDGSTEGELTRVPRRLLEHIGFEKELGLHNAEMRTSPQPFNPAGLRAQRSEVRARLEAALSCTATEGMRLVSDGIWLTPPAGEAARGYLSDSVVDDGVRIATNMSDAVRYHGMANSGALNSPMSVDVPFVDLEAQTVMPESLITSIQPHYQMSHAHDLPQCFNYALRVAGPLLALGVNSPLFPPDCYRDDAAPEAILADGWAENRIAVFESVLNATDDPDKVRFPRDLDSAAEAVDRVVEDPVVVPMPAEETGDRFDDRFATLRLKHGTYWRWVRPVFGGASRSQANARIEFRPVAGQPTVADSIAFQAAFAGLMESLPQRHHPALDMDWAVAERNFYNAARDGLDAELEWIGHDGAATTDHDELFEDLLAHARAGLESAGFSESGAKRYLEPLRVRAERRITPAAWKRDRVRDRLSAGEDFETAVRGTHRAYVENQAATLLDGQFADWLA
ncbi:MAG: hypothetical protein ABEJ79_06600 [Halolamina sp.]